MYISLLYSHLQHFLIVFNCGNIFKWSYFIQAAFTCWFSMTQLVTHSNIVSIQNNLLLMKLFLSY